METFKNHIRSMASLQNVYRLCAHDPGDVYIFVRPDVRFLHDMPIEMVMRARQPNFFASPKFANELGHALNDRFAICGSLSASVYANRIDHAEN